jgi:quercetin dioxygenase-like cupin family protein
MQIANIPFVTTVWANIERTEHKGERGTSYWRTCNFGNIRVRTVDYSPDFLMDHWCSKGHVFYCIAGQLHVELEDGRQFTLTPGVSYQVADNAEAHRHFTGAEGATVFVVD